MSEHTTKIIQVAIEMKDNLHFFFKFGTVKLLEEFIYNVVDVENTSDKKYLSKSTLFHF